MKSVTERIRLHLERRLGLHDKRPAYEDLVESEWSGTFEKYMRNRLIIGALRYSTLSDKDAPRWANIPSIVSRAKEYLKDGNQEHLVDIANLAMIEFCRPSCHVNPSFRALERSDDSPIIRGVIEDQ